MPKLSKDAWVSSTQSICEGKHDLPVLDLEIYVGEEAPDVDLDRLCESLLADLKLPKEDGRTS